MSNKSCRNQSFRPYGVTADDIRRIDSPGADGTANPESYPARPFSSPQTPSWQLSDQSKLAVHTQSTHQTVQIPSFPAPQIAPIAPASHAVVVQNFDHAVAEYAQHYQQRIPQDGPTTYYKNMTKEALLLLQYRSRQSYMVWSPRRVYEDIVDRMEAAYLVMVERHKNLLSFLHQQEQAQLQKTGQVMGLGVQQGLAPLAPVEMTLKSVEAMIERLHAMRWESVNHQTAQIQEQFDLALRRGPAYDGIIAATEQGTDIIESNEKQITITGEFWAREKYKAALAELAVRDPQEYANFWRYVRYVRLEIPKDWSGRYDGEAMPGGVITCNPYISRQRMIGNSVHGGTHLGDTTSKTRAESEALAEQREKAMWGRMGRQNMEVFA